MRDRNDQLIVALEGPDRCGKSNIAQALARYFDVPYFRYDKQHSHFVTPGAFRQATELIEPWQVSFLEQTGHSVVMDRCYLSERVYSRVYHRETCDELLEEIDQRFADLNARLIVPMRHDYSVCEPDEVIEQSKLREIHDEYFRALDWTKCSWTRIYVDSYGSDLDREMSELLAYGFSGHHVVLDGVCRHLDDLAFVNGQTRSEAARIVDDDRPMGFGLSDD